MEHDRTAARVGPGSLFDSPMLRRALAAVFVVLGIASVVSRATSLGSGELVRNDFTQDYVSARAWADGGDPYADTAALVRRYLPQEVAAYEIAYERRKNPHTPFEVVALSPLRTTGFRTARTIWLALSAASIAAGVALVFAEIGVSRRAAAAAGVGALALPVAQKDLLYGQTNGLLLLLLALGWIALRRERLPAAGILLGAATALKLFPALLVVPLFRRGGPRAALWHAGAALVLSAGGAVTLGVDASERFATDVAGDNFAFWRGAPMNLSLTSLPFRWLARGPWRPAVPDLVPLATALAIAAVIVCVAAGASTRASASGDVFWGALPWMVLATPLAWEFSLVLVLPLLGIIGVRALRGERIPMVFYVAAAVLAMGVPPGLPLPGPGNGTLAVALGYGLPTYALIAIGALEWRRARAAP